MTRSPLLLFHIATAAIGLLSGFVALFLRKGSRRHRTFGNVFFVSMLSMSASATYIAIMKPAMISIVPGIFTFYLVATAWATVIRKPGESGLFEFGALLAALGAGIYGLILGWRAAHSATGSDNDGFPAAVYFVFGSLALLASTLDVRMLVAGGISGSRRIVRHLWRMSLALLIAATSFFSGQEQVFPAFIRKTGLLNAPAIVIVVLMTAWLIWVPFSNRFGHGAGEFRTRSRRSLDVQVRKMPPSIAPEK
jgi:uncharacterized membrane protein